MKTINLITIIAALLILGLMACEDVVTNVELPNSQPAVVIFSYISPEADTIRAEVFYSNPINQPGNYSKNTIKDAQVVLKEAGGAETVLQYHEPTDNFVAAIQPGFLVQEKVYTISVSTPKGEKAEATCELPKKNQSLRITDFDSTHIDQMVRYRFKLEFDDNQGKPDYYRLMAKAVVRRIWEADTAIWEYGVWFNYGQELIAVKDNNGKTFAAEGSIEIYRDPYWSNEQLLGLKCYLLSTDEHYYHFHRSLQNYEPDNPFSEPTLIYSNVKDGLGVVAGFNPHKLEFWLTPPEQKTGRH